MTNKKLVKQTLDRRLEEYIKHRNFKEKEDLDRATESLVAQVRMVQEVNLINRIMANEYLSKLEHKYTEILQSEQFKEYREQVINFNDDVITSRERLFHMREQEKENTEKSMNKWKEEIEKKSSHGSNNGSNEKEEVSKSKEIERENEDKENV